ncbi:MAG: TrkA family potassium uptake protein [Clostridiales bacterium]|nr:TrkA family potassium uptake protein [Clostridiales bacterium]
MNMKQYAVIGLGRFGASVARTLADHNREVLAIDSCQDSVDDIMDEVTHCAQADATDIDDLKSLGLRNYDVAVVAISNLEASIMTTALLKELNVKYVVARAASELHGRVLERVGADRVIYPERDMGARLSHNLIHANIMDYIDIAPGYSIVEIEAAGFLLGKTLGKLNLRAKYGVCVLAIRQGDSVLVSPGAEALISAGDVLVALGSEKSLRGFGDNFA